MNESINIPLSIDPTRQAIWRVVHVGGAVLLVTLIAWTIARGLLTYDRTLKLLPAKTDFAVRILKTPDALTLAETKLSGLALFPGAPWSMADALQSSRRGINIATVGEDTIVILDRELPEVVNEAAAFGYSALAKDGLTIIATDEHLLSTEKTLPDLTFSLLFAKYDGIILDTDGHRAPFNIDHDQITLNGVEPFTASNDDALIADGMSVLATLEMPSMFTEKVARMAPPENTPGAQALAALLTTAGTSITIGQDADGIAYNFVIPLNETLTLSNDDFVAIGKEILEIPELAVEKLTLPDGTIVDELRSTAAEVRVIDEHPYVFITVTSGSKTVTITRTSDTLRITNRSIEPSEETPHPKSSCLHRADAWIRPRDLLAAVPTSTTHQSITASSLIRSLGEIAVGNNITRVCW